jgi:hypothetical protein
VLKRLLNPESREEFLRHARLAPPDGRDAARRLLDAVATRTDAVAKLAAETRRALG